MHTAWNKSFVPMLCRLGSTVMAAVVRLCCCGMFCSVLLGAATASAAGVVAGDGTAGSGGGVSSVMGAFGNIVPLIIVVVIFYFLILRPQQKKVKEHQVLLSNLKKGDVVVSMGGIYGTIAKVDHTVVSVEIAQGVVIKLQKDAVSSIEQQRGRDFSHATQSKRVKNDSEVDEKMEEKVDEKGAERKISSGKVRHS